MSSNKQYLMILERSGANLELSKKDNEYVLEGIFEKFGVENNNNRIYEEKEYDFTSIINKIKHNIFTKTII